MSSREQLLSSIVESEVRGRRIRRLFAGCLESDTNVTLNGVLERLNKHGYSASDLLDDSDTLLGLNERLSADEGVDLLKRCLRQEVTRYWIETSNLAADTGQLENPDVQEVLNSVGNLHDKLPPLAGRSR